MSTKLPLLKIPVLVFDEIYKDLNLLDKVQLSLCSRRFKSIVKSYENRSKPFISVEIRKTGCIVDIEPLKIDRMTWVLSLNRDILLTRAQDLVERKVNNDNHLKVGRYRNGYWGGLISVPRDGFFEEDSLNLITYLINLFNTKLSSLSVEFFENLSFEKLFVQTNIFHDIKIVFIRPAACSPEEVTFLFDNLITDVLYFDGSAGEQFSYHKLINSSDVHISDASWMTTQVFMKMTETCKNISLRSVKHVTDKDLNTFIKKWLSGDNKTLESIQLIRQPISYVTPFDTTNQEVLVFEQDVILEGIPTIPGSPKPYGRLRLPLKNRPFCRGLDVRRDDGVLATVLFEHRYDQWRFCFAVWHNLNAN